MKRDMSYTELKVAALLCQVDDLAVILADLQSIGNVLLLREVVNKISNGSTSSCLISYKIRG